MSKTIFNYNHENGEYLSSTIADESPLEAGAYLIPANATDVPLLANVPPRKTQIFVESTQSWQLVDDWRNVPLFDKQTGKPVSITGINIKPADIGATELQPPSALHSWVNDHWALDNTKVNAAFVKKQADKVAALAAACRAEILAGFVCDALGDNHHYPAGDLDQQNLTASVVDSTLPGLPVDWTTPFLCADSNNQWAYRAHTAAQIQQVGRAGKAAILQRLVKNANLAAQVMALPNTATDAQFDAIVW
ncbi:hypothetical protein JWZ98_03110 [Methylomonas sp. EFPC1]|uniref:DUF4376 domain-containing protein n=1 Tax=Methylomonas sp. EFPC1 TaxID=2812647 RepID=UPI0019684314|nr:hypothetical protein [Methylomonas sp. EFPC1]QSB01965.1 hypothetical protein JWZ98_03110 [Methylomonas sp. EFPC1]